MLKAFSSGFFRVFKESLLFVSFDGRMDGNEGSKDGICVGTAIGPADGAFDGFSDGASESSTNPGLKNHFSLTFAALRVILRTTNWAVFLLDFEGRLNRSGIEFARALLQVQAEDSKCVLKNWDHISAPISEVSINTFKEHQIVVDYESDNLCLQYVAADTSDEGLVTWDDHGEDNQKWHIDEFGRIRSKMNHECIDFHPDHERYAKPVIRDCDYVKSQYFIFESDGHIRNRDSL